MPAASTVKPIVGVEDYQLTGAPGDWNEGSVPTTAPQNWAEDGSAVPLTAVPAVAPAAALDWTVCIFFFITFKCFNIILL